MYFEHGRGTTVKTAKGFVRGFQYKDTYHFYGIKYADAKRFEPPEEVKAWQGVKEATNYGYICPGFREERIGNNLKNPHRFWPSNEDCQYLNIWTRELQPDKKKAVLVWFHGGGYFDGSSLEHVSYDGFNLCNAGDVVVVSVNHRLNVLGYLDLSAYDARYARSKNVGNLDLIAALKWIQDNIESFGGDKSNVTLFGQSGGGSKVISVMNMPASKGLFKQGMIMSGVMGEHLSDYHHDMKPLVAKTLELLGIDEHHIEILQKVEHTALCAAYLKAHHEMGGIGLPYIGPGKNEDYLGDPMHYGFSEHAKRAPLIVGSNFSEFFTLPEKYDRNAMSEEEMVHAVETELGKEHAKELLPIFKKAFPDNKTIDILTYDCAAARGVTIDFIKARIKAGCAATYNYFFTPIFGIHDGSTALHSSDIAFIFHNTDLVPSTYLPCHKEKELEYQMAGRLIALAKKGSPQLEGEIMWPPSSLDTIYTMIFDKSCSVKQNFDQELLDKMSKIKTFDFVL